MRSVEPQSTALVFRRENRTILHLFECCPAEELLTASWDVVADYLGSFEVLLDVLRDSISNIFTSSAYHQCISLVYQVFDQCGLAKSSFFIKVPPNFSIPSIGMFFVSISNGLLPILQFFVLYLLKRSWKSKKVRFCSFFASVLLRAIVDALLHAPTLLLQVASIMSQKVLQDFLRSNQSFLRNQLNEELYVWCSGFADFSLSAKPLNRGTTGSFGSYQMDRLPIVFCVVVECTKPPFRGCLQTMAWQSVLPRPWNHWNQPSAEA